MKSAKTPAKRHWEALEIYLHPMKHPMQLNDFQNYWSVSREELAFICGCSLTTVNHWHSQGIDSRTPSEKHKQRLALAHHIWKLVEAEPDYMEYLREIWQEEP